MHSPPWSDGSSPLLLNEAKAFASVDAEARAAIASSELRLSQFGALYGTDRENFWRKFDGLRWRHYFVYSCGSLAIRKASASGDSVSLAECGVCDGLTMFYAMGVLSEAGAKRGGIHV
jgi:hypothetical protein